jgi:hypothetical protein
VTEIKGFLHYALLSVVTVILLVVLGNWLGILGIILALILPMLVEVVRSVA